MDFNFRSLDERSSAYFSPPGNFSFFTQQAIRAGFPGPGPREFGPRNPNGAALQRELEKERIRAEIIAEEIVRRRVLEEEVRREMMMEREFAMRFGPGPNGGPNPSINPMRLEPRVPLLTNFENNNNRGERFGSGSGSGPGFGSGVGVSAHREVGFGGSPFQRDPVVAGNGNGNGSGSSSGGVTLQEIKSSGPEVVNKDKVIILAKPKANSADLKRKATASPDGANLELTSVGLKKPKTKDDWSCALCRVTATSERGLNEHLQGKKHKAREKGMVSQRMGFGVGPLPKKSIANTSKSNKAPRTTTPNSKKKDETTEGTSSFAKIDEASAQKMPGAEGIVLQKKESSVDKKEIGSATPLVTPASDKPRKKFKLWCEICQVGAFTQKVMDAHKRGKKHLANVNQTGEPTVENKSAQNVVVDEKKEPDAAAEEIKQITDAEQVECKEECLNSDVPRTEDKDKVIESAGDVIIEEDTNKVPPSNEADIQVPASIEVEC